MELRFRKTNICNNNLTENYDGWVLPDFTSVKKPTVYVFQTSRFTVQPGSILTITLPFIFVFSYLITAPYVIKGKIYLEIIR